MDARTGEGPDGPTLDGNEATSFGLIATAGDARAQAFEALAAARKGDFDQADRLLGEADHEMVDAHRQQTDLLTRFARGESVPVDVLLVHAQDHLMTSILAQELIGQLVLMYKTIGELQERLDAEGK